MKMKLIFNNYTISIINYKKDKQIINKIYKIQLIRNRIKILKNKFRRKSKRKQNINKQNIKN